MHNNLTQIIQLFSTPMELNPGHPHNLFKFSMHCVEQLRQQLLSKFFMTTTPNLQTYLISIK